jgi:hypothetical protein
VEDLAGVRPGGRDEELGLALADEVGLDLWEVVLEGMREAQLKEEGRRDGKEGMDGRRAECCRVRAGVNMDRRAATCLC